MAVPAQELPELNDELILDELSQHDSVITEEIPQDHDTASESPGETVKALLARSREISLARGVEAGDEAALSDLIESHLYLAKIAVNKALGFSSGQREIREDLLQEGRIGLVLAANKYDYRRDVRFATFAWRYVFGAVIDALRNSSNPRKPRSLIDSFKAAVNIVPDSSTGEISKVMGISEVEYMALFTENIPIHRNNDGVGFEDLMSAPEEEIAGNKIDQLQILENLETTYRLDETEKLVILLYFGFDDGRNYSLWEIGEEMGFTESRASQILSQGLGKIRAHHKFDGWEL
jgi:RNA polymerase primary sigma factor